MTNTLPKTFQIRILTHNGVEHLRHITALTPGAGLIRCVIDLETLGVSPETYRAIRVTQEAN